MGSTTERVKTSAIVIAYLASFLVVAAAPSAVAPTDSTPETTVAQSHVSADWEFDMDANDTEPSDFEVQVDTVYDDIRVFNVPNGTDNVTIHSPGDDRSNQTIAYAVTDVGDDPDGNKQEAIFSNIEFDEVGDWWNITAFDDNNSGSTTDDTILLNGTFEVVPLIDIDVTVTPVERNFPGNRTVKITVQATWQANGSAVEGADVTIINSVGEDISGTQTTDADGKLVINRNFWNKNRGADEYEVTVLFPDDTNPKHQGTTTKTVNPAAPRLDSSSGVPPTHGFTSEVEYIPIFPSGDPLDEQRILADHHLPGANGNFSFFNVTLLEGDTVVDSLNVSTSGAPHDSDHSNMTVDVNGNLTIERQWADADYQVNITVERSGNDTKPEYERILTFVPQNPANVNLRIDPEEGQVPDRDAGEVGAEGDRIRPDGLADGDDPSVILNDGNFTLTILGDTENDFPEAADLEIDVGGQYVGNPVFLDDGNMEIDFDNGGTVTDGIVNVTNITPARGADEITFEVTWADQGTGEISADVNLGDILTTDTDQVTVGVNTTVTLQLDDTKGNYLADGDVSLFWDNNGTTIESIDGDGDPGEGQQGEYIFDVLITEEVGKVVAHSVDLQDRHAYTEFEIVPAHDLDTVVSPEDELAGRNTEYTLNVTREGDAFDDEGDDVDVFVLNDDQWDDFQDNGTDALQGLPNNPVATTRDSEGNYTFDWQAAAGTYHVYVRTSPKNLHDNDGQMSTIELHRPEASFTPDGLVSTVDTNVTVDIHLHDPTVADHNDSELNGTLVANATFLEGGAAPGNWTGKNATFWENDNEQMSGLVGNVLANDVGGTDDLYAEKTGVDVENGDASIENVTAERAGNIWFYFQDEETGAVYALTDQPLEVAPPDVSITPDTVCVGVTTQIIVTVTHPRTGDPIADADIELIQAGEPGLDVNTTTDANGEASITVVAPTSNTVDVLVNGDEASEFTPTRCLSVQFETAPLIEGEDATVQISQRGETEGEDGVTILIDGSSVGTTGSDGRLTFTAPSAGQHTLTAQKAGFADRTRDFTVDPATQGAQFQVSSVSVPSPEDGFKVDETYTIQGTIENVGDESGTVTAQFLVNNAVVDSTTITLDAGQSQQVAFQWTPSSTGDVTLAVQADGHEESRTVNVSEDEPTVPGFEIVAVLAALGAAAVAMRRRD